MTERRQGQVGKARRAGLAAGLVGLVGSCGGISPHGAPPGEIRPVIDSPADHRIFFETEDLKHVVSLHDDGSYLFKSGSDLEGVVDTRDGRWEWKKTGTHSAELRLDRDIWDLKFAGYDSAFAKNRAAPGRTRIFQFEEFGAERGGP